MHNYNLNRLFAAVSTTVFLIVGKKSELLSCLVVKEITAVKVFSYNIWRGVYKIPKQQQRFGN